MLHQQECIPVGCVPAAYWPLGGCFLPSMHCFFPRGCFLPSMHCILPRGASFPACTASFPGGLPSQHALCLSQGGLPSQHALLLSQGGASFPACTETDPPVNRMTDTSKKITLATTSLRSVKKRRILEGYVALVPYYI